MSQPFYSQKTQYWSTPRNTQKSFILRLCLCKQEEPHAHSGEIDHLFRRKSITGQSEVTRDEIMSFGSPFAPMARPRSRGVSFQFELVGIVHETVENRVGEGRVTDDVMHLSTGSWLVTTVERTAWRSSRSSSRS